MSIASQDFNQFLNMVRVKLTGASDAGIKAELYDVLSEFFNDSSSWTESVTINAVPNVTSYSLSVTEGQILRLDGVIDANNFPQPAIMATIGTLTLAHAPNTAQTYMANLVKNVALPTTKDMLPIAPSWVLPVWHLGILDGVLGKMAAQPNKSYSNETMATYHLKRFRDAIARARVSKLRANTVGAQAWSFPKTFHSNNQRGGVPGFGGSDRSF